MEIFTTTRFPTHSPPGVGVHSIRAIPVSERNPIPLGLHKQLETAKLDVLHFHSPWYFTSILPLMHDSPRAFMTVHGLLPKRRSISRDYALGLLYLPALAAVRKCSCVIALTTSEEREVERMFGIPSERLYRIPNGVDPDCCQNAGRTRNDHPTKGRARILFVGRASRDSRVRVAVEAFLALHALMPGSTLTLAGPGTDGLLRGILPKLPPGIQGSVKGMGVVARSTLCRLYSSHDVFVSLGTWEGLPTRVLEAMLHGCVPVVSDSGGISDLVNHLENGIVLRETSPLTVRAALKNLSDDPGVQAALSKAATKTVLERFLWPRVFEEIMALYERTS